jgi:hypothetical protein
MLVLSQYHIFESYKINIYSVGYPLGVINKSMALSSKEHSSRIDFWNVIWCNTVYNIYIFRFFRMTVR